MRAMKPPAAAVCRPTFCRLVFLFFIFSPTLTVAQSPAQIHVAPDGSDSYPGTASQPVASLTKAVQLAEAQPGTIEIIVRGGVYPLAQSARIPRSRKTTPLVIRAAEGETPIFDGAADLPPSAPLVDAPGVFVFHGDFPSDEPPVLWEEKSGHHFIGLAGIESVRVKDRSTALLDANTLAARCFGGLPPEEVGLRMGGPKYGIEVLRDHVTLRGLHFRNFCSSKAASAVMIGGTGLLSSVSAKGRERQGTFVTGTVVEDCFATNCYTGFRVYLSARDSTLRRCRTRDTVCGIYVSGIDTTIEDCVLVNDPGFHRQRLGWDYKYDRCGIRFYSGPEGGVVRRCLIQGFEQAGIHSKGSPGRFLVEHNTFIGMARSFSIDAGFILHHNIFADCTIPFSSDLKGEIEAEIDHNLFWGPHDLTAVIQNPAIGGAPHNRFGDPLFANPAQGDFRLLPGSAALHIQGITHAGAFDPVPADYQGPPNLRLSLVKRQGGNAEVRLHTSGVAPAAVTRWTIDDQPLSEAPFQATQTFALPSADCEHRLRVQVRDAQDRLSSIETLALPPPPDKPSFIGEPMVETSRFGALIAFTANQNAEANVEVHDGGGWKSAGKAAFGPSGARRPVLITGLAPGQAHRFRLTLGRQTQEGAFTLDGPPRHLYVGISGHDREGTGSRERPFASLDFALQKALPGDRVRLLPGAYFDAASLVGRGGMEGHPLIIEAVYPGTVVLDGLRETGTLLRFDKAPHLVLRGLHCRWYVDTAVHLADSPGVRVTGCRFINQPWRGSSGPTCRTLMIQRCPGITVDHCVFARTRYGITIQDSPGARVLHNTGLANLVTHLLWRGGPEDDLTVQYNSFHWNDNSLMSIDFPFAAKPARAVIDYNNYGTSFKREAGFKDRYGLYGVSLPKPQPYLPSNREFISGTRRFVNMEDWLAFSGLDQHSLYADPKFVDPAAGRFDVAADSPNLLPNGKVIGALGYLGDKPPVPLDIVLTSPISGDSVSGLLSLSAEASALEGAITKVEFLLDGKVIAQAAAPPYQTTAPSPQPGRHTLAARAIHASGVVALSDPVEVEAR